MQTNHIIIKILNAQPPQRHTAFIADFAYIRWNAILACLFLQVINWNGWILIYVSINNCSNDKELSSHYNLGECSVLINLESKKRSTTKTVWSLFEFYYSNIFLPHCSRGERQTCLHHIRKASLILSTCMNPICGSDDELIWRSIYIQGSEHKSVVPAVCVKLQSMLQLFDRSSIVRQAGNSWVKPKIIL